MNVAPSIRESSRSSWRWGALSGLLLLASACASSQEGPRLASSAGSPGYASSYPARVSGTTEGLTVAESEVRRVSAEMPAWPAELEKVEASLARDVVRESDAAGKSRAYAAQQVEAAEVVRFFSEEKDKLGQQVSGSVRYSLKEKGAGSDLVEAGGAAASYGLPKAIQKQLDERAQDANPAHRLIDEREDELDKGAVEKLRKRADELARVSYLVRVYLPAERRRIGELLEESSEVKGTLEKTIEGEGAIARDPATKPKRKSLAEARVKDAEAALGRLDSDLSAAREADKTFEEKIRELTELYEKALAELIEELEEGSRASGPAS